VLALLDALERPARADATCAAVRGALAGADAARLAALVELLAARDAHAVIEGLSRAGMIEPQIAQIVHARVDLRPDPAPARR
jgi:hypothetical protein